MLKWILGFLLTSSQVMACTDGTGFLPDNNLKIPPHIKSGLTREQYDEAIDKVLKVYSPIARIYGGRLNVMRLWDSEVVNAGTIRENGGKTWTINLYGGFARHPYITQDGFMLVVCHEIGHHIGGAPKKIYGSGAIWSSTEGQSDYFATLKCLRKVFAIDDNIEIIKDADVPMLVRTECETSFKREWEQALCIRTSLAGLSVAKVNADGRQLPSPEFEAIDPTEVETTNNNHPVPQCRLNTYYEGSICPVPSTRTVSQIFDAPGTCHPKTKFTRGLRPACWYHAK
ncbi:MAG: hypothetical protein ACJ76H_10800 [Bacteriovoracaceae bacterium]